MRQNMGQTCKLCQTKKTVLMNVTKSGAWRFPTAEVNKRDNGDLHTVAVEVDGDGRFIEVWSNGERFTIDAAEVAELATSIIPPSVLGAVRAYDGTEGVPVRDLTKEQLRRIESYERRRLTA